jgi:hypothetical protein
VDALVHVISSTVDERVQQLAMLALGCHCELHPDSQAAARSLGAVQLLFEALKEGSDATKEVASTTLIHLTDIPTPTEVNYHKPARLTTRTSTTRPSDPAVDK